MYIYIYIYNIVIRFLSTHLDASVASCLRQVLVNLHRQFPGRLHDKSHRPALDISAIFLQNNSFHDETTNEAMCTRGCQYFWTKPHVISIFGATVEIYVDA